MDIDQFWKIIDTSRNGASDVDEQEERLLQLLEPLSEEDLLEFDRLLSERLAESFRRDLWAVAYLAKGGCSDDGFEYFRRWLVAQGRKYFEASLADPAHAASSIHSDDDAEFESLAYLAAQVYESKTGKPDFYDRAVRVEQVLTGQPWTEDDLPRLYPRLARKYGWDGE